MTTSDLDNHISVRGRGPDATWPTRLQTRERAPRVMLVSRLLRRESRPEAYRRPFRAIGRAVSATTATNRRLLGVMLAELFATDVERGEQPAVKSAVGLPPSADADIAPAPESRHPIPSCKKRSAGVDRSLGSSGCSTRAAFG